MVIRSRDERYRKSAQLTVTFDELVPTGRSVNTTEVTAAAGLEASRMDLVLRYETYDRQIELITR